MNILISIAAFVFTIGVLVTVHEFGHFIVARRLGIRVLRFSVGFGKPLWRWQRRPDSTEYVLGWLPLGGYVKMLDEREGEVSEADRPLAFNRQSLWKRVPVVLAGPTFNLLFAVLVYWVLFMVGIPGIRPIVGAVTKDSPAAVAGLAKHDEILAVGAHRTPTWNTVGVRLLEDVMHGGSVPLKVRTPDGRERQLRLHVTDAKALMKPGRLLAGIGLSPWSPALPAVIESVAAGGPARAAGLRPRDRVTQVGPTPIRSWQQLVSILQKSPGETLSIKVERGRRTLSLSLPVGRMREHGGRTIGYIGVRVRVPPNFGARLKAEERYNPIVALGHAVGRTGSLIWLTLDASWNMVVGKVSLRNLSGPVGIAQYAGYTARSGLVPFLAFLAIVSISLGVLNLLPIPVLDGGHVAYYIVEAVKGSPLSARAEMLGQRVGIALLLVLMGFAVYNDLMRLLP